MSDDPQFGAVVEAILQDNPPVYHGRPMRAEQTIEEARKALDKTGAVHVTLEPGDATRYDIVICRYRGYLLVTRLVGLNPVGSNVLPDYLVPWRYVAPLADGNPWTCAVLTWFLRAVNA